METIDRAAGITPTPTIEEAFEAAKTLITILSPWRDLKKAHRIQVTLQSALSDSAELLPAPRLNSDDTLTVVEKGIVLMSFDFRTSQRIREEALAKEDFVTLKKEANVLVARVKAMELLQMWIRHGGLLEMS